MTNALDSRNSPGGAGRPRRRPPTGSKPGSGRASGPGRATTRTPPADRAAAPLPDPARRVAYDLLRAVAERDAYANLVLPGLLRERRLDGRDAALATELAYGTVRAQGTLDDILAVCASRPLDSLDARVLDVLRLGAYQLLRTRIPPHAAVSATVELARATGSARASGLVNAVLRRVCERDWNAWCDRVAVEPTPLARLAARYAHPLWIAEAFAASLAAGGSAPEGPEDPAGPAGPAEIEAALAADDTRPATHLVARPGRIDRDQLVAASEGSHPGPYSPFAVRMDGGEPGALLAIRDGRAGVQDEGSQLCALALIAAPITPRIDGPTGPGDQREAWLDMCAGPGGKAALLAALAGERGAVLVANELREHRAELVRRATAHWDVAVTVGDAAAIEARPDGYDRVLLDAPCTGLGALRRRPESRWRRQPADVRELAALQARLLDQAVRLVRPGGVIAYVTCSPHLGETRDVVTAAADRWDLEFIDARPGFPGVPELGPGPTVQLWPHRHGTDAMFCALLRRR